MYRNMYIYIYVHIIFIHIHMCILGDRYGHDLTDAQPSDLGWFPLLKFSLYICIYVYICVHIYTYIHIHMYTYI